MRNKLLVSISVLFMLGTLNGFGLTLKDIPNAMSFSGFKRDVDSVNQTNLETTVSALEAGTLDSGATITGGNTDVEALDVFQSGLISVTNNGTYAVTSGVTVVFSTGSANLGTNAITLTRPTSSGFRYLVNSDTSSNLVSIAQSGSYDTPAIELGIGETLFLTALEQADGSGTNVWLGMQLYTTNAPIVDASIVPMMDQHGTWTNGQGAITFPIPFAATPVHISITWADAIAHITDTNTQISASARSSVGFTPSTKISVAVGATATNATWRAKGAMQ